MINRRQTDRETRITVILCTKADEIMCKEVGMEQIVREMILLSSFNVNSNSLSSFRAVLPDQQTDKAASVWGISKVCLVLSWQQLQSCC